MSRFGSSSLSTKNLTARIKWPASRDRTEQKAIAARSGLAVSNVCFFQLTHFEKRHQEGQGRFGSLIFISPVGMQAISTSTRGRVVQSNLQVVVAEEPVERRPCRLAPAALPCGTIRLQIGRDGGAGFDRLLIKASLFGFRGVETVRADGNEMAFGLATLHCRQPFERFEPGGYHGFVCAPHSRANQCLRQSSV